MKIHLASMMIGITMLLFFGCISFDYSQKVDREGNSVITETIDMSALFSVGSRYANTSGANLTSQLSEICNNLTKKDTSIKCTYDRAGILSVTKKINANSGQYIFIKTSAFPDVIYTLEVRKLPQIIELDNISTDMATSSLEMGIDFKDPTAKLVAATFKTMSISIKYSVEMPGELISAENGKIVVDSSGKKIAKYDALELMTEGNYIVVKSKELDVVTLAMVGGAAVLLIGGIIVAMTLLKKK